MLNPVIKILVADDHTLFRQGVIRLLSDNQNFVVVAEAENGEELYKKYFQVRPDVVLADISMPDLSGIDAFQKIKAEDKSVKVLFLSMFESEDYVYETYKSGAMGLINKNILEGELYFAIQNVYKGKKYFGSRWDELSLQKLVKDFEQSPKFANNSSTIFSEKEIKILDLISKGLTSKEIAEQLYLSKKSIDYYRANLMRKADVKNKSELVKFAVNYIKKHN
ncbi:MAG TPA: response regulator transcription factor [Ignavibacteriaceae bacterium]|nr:response regulator transcription factor [Ignavibacteriaceae bacterium]